jgi:very-short-patch-repair endonuclease
MSKYIKHTQEEFIEKAIKKHGIIYDYSLVEYEHCFLKIKIICREHGIFEQRPASHLKGQGCKKCGEKNKIEKQSYDIHKFTEKANKIHSFKYDYSKSEYSHSQIKIKIICRKHGEFWQMPNDHLRGAGCPDCSESKGEIKIKEWLKANNINYIQEYKFEDCKFQNTNGIARFDFYLPEKNILIEYDGQQHFKPFSWSSDKSKETMKKNLEIVKERDSIKNKYALDNNFKLIRIPFSKYNFIEEILNISIKD